MPSAAAISIYLFGATSLLAGVANLLFPEQALASLDLPESALGASNGMSLAAIAMGLYYPLAAAQNNRTFFKFTIGMRMLTATVFWHQGGPWRIPSLWEGFGAALTAAALAWDARGARIKQQ
ncbi:hypothetical protein ABW19_dt0201306 [Dactylella cylindrospora]|nr:hypothetical protein ABW19_dt0201306 [Dactylella cylindrospora]